MRVHLEHITLLRAGKAGESRGECITAHRTIKIFNTLQLRLFEKGIK